MITTNILWIILFISFILIISGLFFKKKALILVIFGGILLMITGVTTFTEVISIPTIIDNYTYDNLTLTNVTEVLNPTPIDSRLNNILSWTMTLIGLACIIGSSIKLYDSRFDEDDPEQIQIFDK